MNNVNKKAVWEDSEVPYRKEFGNSRVAKVGRCFKQLRLQNLVGKIMHAA